MNLQRFSAGVIFVLGTYSVQIHAQDNPTNVELMRKLYAELAAILAVDVGDQQRSGTFLILNPAGGTILDPNLDVSDNFQRSILVNTVLDIRLRESWIKSQRPGSIASIYRSILRDRKTPSYQLTSAEEAEFTSIDRRLYVGSSRDESRFLKKYRDAENNLVLAIGKVENFQKENPGQTVPRVLYAELRSATDRYNNDAQGPTARQMLSKHTELQRRRGAAWISDLEEQFDRNFNSTENFGEVRLYPGYAQWLDKTSSWTKINIDSKELERRTHNSSSSFSGGISGSWGMWSWGGNYDRDEQRGYMQASASNLKLGLEVIAVQIRYPWMDFGVFESRAWDWSDSAMYKGIPLSDGKFSPETDAADGELLPFVPTTILLARNVVMSADWGFDVESFFKMRESARGSVGWGPLSLGGRRTKTEENTYTLGKAKGSAISFEDPQIIGYFVYKVPRSPYPDPKLPWGTEESVKGFISQSQSSPILDRAKALLTQEKR